MRVVIRADGGGDVGWGHLGRSVALAEVLTACDVQVDWACRSDDAVIRLVGRSADLCLSGRPSFETLPRSEALALAAFAEGAEWLLVDHYGAGEAYLATLRQHCSAKLMVFDDHQKREGVDLRLAPMQDAAERTLAGASYQPVRACFSRALRSDAPQGWLLCLGGADPRDDTKRCIEALLRHKEALCVLASDAIAERQGLDALLAKSEGRAKRIAWLHAEELATTLASCHAALVSASTLSWEAMAARTPIVALKCADNQAGVARTLKAAAIPTFEDALEAAEGFAQGLARLPLAEARLDGLGAWRVAHAMGVKATWPNGLDLESKA